MQQIFESIINSVQIKFDWLTDWNISLGRKITSTRISFLTQILTQENWNLVMYDGMRSTNKWAALYFTALMTVGYYVLFNLLVAILVEGFTNSGVGKIIMTVNNQ